MDTYETITTKVEQLQKQLALWDALRERGIPTKYVQYYETPAVRSGYRMGETVRVYCNDKLIEVADRTEDYARSCKWRAKHGLVVIRFTQKALRQYIDLERAIWLKCYDPWGRLKNRPLDAPEEAALLALCAERNKLLEACLDKDESRMKR